MEIKRSEVMERVGAESVASHYFSAPESGKNHEDVRRVALLRESRYPLVNQWADEAMERVMARLCGWCDGISIMQGTLKINLIGQYAVRENMVRMAAMEMMAADVWQRIAEQQFPEKGAEALKRLERAEDRLMSLMCR